MTKKELKKALRWLPSNTEILIKDEDGLYHGVENISYSIDSSNNTSLIISVQKLRR